MKRLFDNLLNVFKRKEKRINELNVQEMCKNAKGELASYCDN